MFFQIFDKDPYAIHLDHGRAFGKALHDQGIHLKLLAPVSQRSYFSRSVFPNLFWFEAPLLGQRSNP